MGPNGMRRLPIVAAIFVTLMSHTSAQAQGCAGDCNNDGSVVVSELITGVNIALGKMRATVCSAMDSIDQNAEVSVGELIRAVRSAAETAARST